MCKAPKSIRASSRRPLPKRKVTRTTVIIPVFNHESLTRQCLEALLDKIGHDVEIIVVDDGSTDATPKMLAEYGDRVRLVRHATNSGFAQSCNDGAAAASSEYLVFLNNDTIPQPGWLKALELYVENHPEASVVGSRLLYPNNTIQHAGVVICQDRYPRHIYMGFPAEHPAVNKSRRFQIVTAACMLVRKSVFEQAEGFDTTFRNGFEDVDLCLRLGKAGREIHYCAESVVQHLESVSPGRFKNDRDNIALYRERWLSRVQPDDLGYYVEDRLLTLAYEGAYPFNLHVSPLLAVWDVESRKGDAESLLVERSRQVADLTRENTRLRVELSGRVHDSPALRYEKLRQQIREVIGQTLPPDAAVLVVSKGDRALLDLDGRKACHFPQTANGTYVGHHPADSSEAIAHLEALREKGWKYLLFPSTAFWWLEHYKQFRRHLESRYRAVLRQNDICLLFALREPVSEQAPQPFPLAQNNGKATVLAEPTGISKRMPPNPKKGNKRRVLYVCHNHPMIFPGGAEVYALELYEAMRTSNEWEPIFLARTGSNMPIASCSPAGSHFDHLDEDRNQYFFRTKTADFDLFYLASRNKEIYTRDFHEFLLAHQPDVVHFQHTQLLGYELIAQARHTLPNAAIFYTLHEYLPICHRNGQMVRAQNEELCHESSPHRCHDCFPEVRPEAFIRRKQFIQSHFALVDLFVAPSQFLLERYVAWGIPREKMRYEDYGRRALLRLEESEEERPRNRLGFFGQLNPFKGINVLLRAMRILGADNREDYARLSQEQRTTTPSLLEDALGPLSRESNLHLWIHGANLELQREDFQDEFQTLLEATKHNVTFVGPYDQAELPALMANIDWVVVPSIWWENSPLVIQEAFGHRRPVICSNIGAMAEKVRDGVDGLHFRTGEPRSLAETIERAATTQGLWNKLVRGIPEVYSMEQHTRFLSQLYNTVLGTKMMKTCR